METLVHQKKMFRINFSKAKTKFWLSLHYNDDNSYVFINGKEIYKFEDSNGNANFLTRFCLGSMSDRFSVIESREVSLGGNVHNLSVDYNAIDKSDILDIHRNSMVKKNIK